jgi:hypothetical protein
MKSRVVVLTLLITGSAFAAERWWSPDKAYSIVPPPDWSQSTSKGEQSSSYAFTSPDHKAEIRVSAAYHISLPENMPDDVLEMAFPKERGTTPIARVHGTAWDGLRREYTNADESARWLGFAARHGSTVVLLTMKAPAKDFERFRPIFEAVGQSITLAQ